MINKLKLLTLAGVATLINGQFGRDQQTPEKSFIQIPRLNIDVMVECKSREINVIISKEYIERNMQWLGGGEDLSLEDYSCKTVQDRNGNRTISVKNDFTKCGNRISTESIKNNQTGAVEITKYKISNKLIHDDAQGAIQRVIDLLEFECVYPATTITSQYMQPWLKSAAHEDRVKEISGAMRLYKDENYTNSYMHPPELSLDDELFIQVELQKPLITGIDEAQTNIAVVMEQCWGTPTADRSGEGISEDSVMKYIMIDNGCPRDDPSLEIISNGESLISQYRIKMFKFIGENLNDVWLHCTVRACNNTIPENCIPDCGNSRSRRALGGKKQKKKKLWYVSGPQEITTELPIQRKMTEEEAFLEMERARGNVQEEFIGTPAFKTMIIVFAIIVALSLVFTIIVIYVKRRAAILSKIDTGMRAGGGDVVFGKTMGTSNLVTSSGASSSSSSLPTEKLPYGQMP